MGLLSSIFGSNSSNQSSSTTSYNSADTFAPTDSHNVTTNSSSNYSSNSTSNNTNTNTQDQRMVNDHGIGISADASTISTANSGNNTTSTTNSSSYSTQSNYYATDLGAVGMGGELARAAIASNQAIAAKSTDIGSLLTKTGMDMLMANIEFAEHLSERNSKAQENSLNAVMTSTRDALTEVTNVAKKPLNAQDPQHILVIVGLVVVGVVLFAKR